MADDLLGDEARAVLAGGGNGPVTARVLAGLLAERDAAVARVAALEAAIGDARGLVIALDVYDKRQGEDKGDPGPFLDRLRCIAAAAAPSTPAPETPSDRVVDLMGALEASVTKARDARRAIPESGDEQ